MDTKWHIWQRSKIGQNLYAMGRVCLQNIWVGNTMGDRRIFIWHACTNKLLNTCKRKDGWMLNWTPLGIATLSNSTLAIYTKLSPPSIKLSTPSSCWLETARQVPTIWSSSMEEKQPETHCRWMLPTPAWPRPGTKIYPTWMCSTLRHKSSCKSNHKPKKSH